MTTHATAASALPQSALLVGCSSSLNAASAGTSTLHLVDLANPNANHKALLSFKSIPSPLTPHCVCAVPSTPSRAGFVMASSAATAHAHAWTYAHPAPARRYVLPTSFACVATSPSGTYLAAGTASNQLLIYHLGTGALLRSFQAHFRGITLLRWTSDGHALVSASLDARIVVWSLAALLADPDLQKTPTAYATLTDHSLPITDLHVEPGAFPARTRVWSASKDGHVKLWDLRTRTLVSTFAFPSAITSLAVDPCGRFFFAAAGASSADRAKEASGSTAANEEGKAYRVDLFRRTDEARGGGLVAVGGGGLGSAERWEAGGKVVITPHAITTLLLAPTASTLLVGTAGGTLCHVDVRTCQVIRSSPLGIQTSQSQAGSSKGASGPTSIFAVTFLQHITYPPELPGVSAKQGGSAPKTQTGSSAPYAPPPAPTLPLPLQLARSGRSEADTLERRWPIVIPDSAVGNIYPPSLVSAQAPYNVADLLTTPALATLAAVSHARAPASAPSDGYLSLSTPTSSSKNAENAALRAQLQEAQKLNDAMWAHVVKLGISASGSQRTGLNGAHDAVAKSVPNGNFSRAEGSRKRAAAEEEEGEQEGFIALPDGSEGQEEDGAEEAAEDTAMADLDEEDQSAESEDEFEVDDDDGELPGLFLEDLPAAPPAERTRGASRTSRGTLE